MLVEALRVIVGPESACRGREDDYRGLERDCRSREGACRSCESHCRGVRAVLDNDYCCRGIENECRGRQSAFRGRVRVSNSFCLLNQNTAYILATT